ncbi:heparinase II/III domain-containing protein [Paenibacillus piri]|uniref:Heparinase II/III-like C-terminal domain-containing protein n=1 Tax=Paenibacillus piri TaxID=2547395 RepID=A0A4R5K803_9BACL|nr:heparinase II/III family protein [Paenibacillus piri]TDF91241.1 hypothetical protein E1757_33225 [Paenibacillus piri]
MDYRGLQEALEYGTRAASGKQALFGEGHAAHKWQEIKQSAYYRELLQEVVATGELLLNEPIIALPYSQYKIFDETGSRIEYERAYFARRQRLNTFAILSMTYGEPRYIEALENSIWAICDEYTWCLPAHLNGTSISVVENINGHTQGMGELRAKVREHRRVVDLFASETGFALTEIVSMLEDKLAPLIVYRARKEVKERILDPFCELNASFHWERLTMNWAAVCGAGVGAAAMYLIEDDAMLAPIVQRLIATMDCFLSGFQEDGACTEGIAYWNYGFGFFVYFAELLKQRTGGKVDLMQGEKIKQIALFQQKSYLTGDYTVSFSDASLRSAYQLGLTHHLKKRYPELEVPHVKYRAGFNDDHCYRWAHAIRNLVWSDSGQESADWGEAFYYLQDSQMLVSRKGDAERMVCFAAKGGHNDEPHNQNDIGSFILHVNGETLLTDPGAGQYTKQYFGKERYTFICNGSHGHSVPVIAGGYQLQGEEHRAQIMEADSSEGKDSFVLDIAKAYGNDSLQSLIRSFTFDKNGRLTVQDRFKFAQPTAVTERFVSYIEPVVLPDGRIRIQGKNGIELLYDANKLASAIQCVDFVNHQSENVQLYLIDLTLKSPAVEEQLTIRVELI